MSETQKQVPARFTAALERLDGDVGLLREMAIITSEDLPDVRDSVDIAIGEGDDEKAASSLHKLKGMLSTFESDGVTLEIQGMLDLARQGKMGELRQAYVHQKPAIEELADQIGKLTSE